MSKDFLLEDWNDIKLADSNPDTTKKKTLGLTTSSDLTETKVLISSAINPRLNVKTTSASVDRSNNSGVNTTTSQRTTRKNVPYNPNGNVAVNCQIKSSEAAKLLEISSDSTSESDLNLQLSAPKRKVRFKRKFRPLSRTKSKSSAQDLGSCGSCRCSDSLGIFAFICLAVCVVVILWFHYNLRARMDDIQKQYIQLEAQNKETPEALHDYHIQLKNLEFNVSSFAEELKKLNSEISSISEEFKQLKITTNNLKESIAAAPEIKDLPKTVLTVSQTAATLGSKIAILETTVSELKQHQNELKETSLNITKEHEIIKESVNEALEKTRKEQISQRNLGGQNELMVSQDRIMAYVRKEVLQLSESIDDLNSTVIPKLNSLSSFVDGIKEMNDSLRWALDDLAGLHTYVYTNLTVRKNIETHEASLDQALQKMISNAMSAKGNNPKGSWQELFQEASQLSLLYLDISGKLLSSRYNNNTTEADANKTKTKPQIIAENLVNAINNNCLRNVQLVNRSVEAQSAELKSFQTSMNQTVQELLSKTDQVTLQLARLQPGLTPPSSSSSSSSSIPGAVPVNDDPNDSLSINQPNQKLVDHSPSMERTSHENDYDDVSSDQLSVKGNKEFAETKKEKMSKMPQSDSDSAAANSALPLPSPVLPNKSRILETLRSNLQPNL